MVLRLTIYRPLNSSKVNVSTLSVSVVRTPGTRRPELALPVTVRVRSAHPSTHNHTRASTQTHMYIQVTVYIPALCSIPAGSARFGSAPLKVLFASLFSYGRRINSLCHILFS